MSLKKWWKSVVEVLWMVNHSKTLDKPLFGVDIFDSKVQNPEAMVWGVTTDSAIDHRNVTSCWQRLFAMRLVKLPSTKHFVLLDT